MYYLIITYHGSGTQSLMCKSKQYDHQAICSDEENKKLLTGIGDRLINENIISSYQLVQTVGGEVNYLNKSIVVREIDC